jgi:hypothetical protein
MDPGLFFSVDYRNLMASSDEFGDYSAAVLDMLESLQNLRSPASVVEEVLQQLFSGTQKNKIIRIMLVE